MAEKVIAKILEEAEGKSREILRSAKDECDKIRKRASAEVARISGEANERSIEKARQERERILASARLDVRKAILERKQQVMDEAFKKAAVRLRQKNAKEYVELIKRLLLESVETGSEEVVVGHADREIVNSEVIAEVNRALGEKGNLTLSQTSGSMVGGFVLRRGKVDLNLSFDSLIEVARERLETEVARILFEE